MAIIDSPVNRPISKSCLGKFTVQYLQYTDGCECHPYPMHLSGVTISDFVTEGMKDTEVTKIRLNTAVIQSSKTKYIPMKLRHRV